MKYLIKITLAVSITLVMTGCTTAGSSKIYSSQLPIYIPPFYYSMGPIVNVGVYSEGLRSSSKQTVNETIERMESEQQILRPEQMYVASIRLYDLGKRDESVYWFYKAQYISKLFNNVLDQSKRANLDGNSIHLQNSYRAFHKITGPYLNGYAGCDPDRWMSVIERVIREHTVVPDLNAIFPEVDLLAKKDWQPANVKVAEGMEELVNYIELKKPNWEGMRSVGNQDQKYCG